LTYTCMWTTGPHLLWIPWGCNRRLPLRGHEPTRTSTRPLAVDFQSTTQSQSTSTASSVSQSVRVDPHSSILRVHRASPTEERHVSARPVLQAPCSSRSATRTAPRVTGGSPVRTSAGQPRRMWPIHVAISPSTTPRVGVARISSCAQGAPVDNDLPRTGARRSVGSGAGLLAETRSAGDLGQLGTG
jgi:hypothetical protein